MSNPLPIAATFSKDPKMFARGFEPSIASSGSGAYVLSGGHSYLDWISALGANVLGYSNPNFIQRVSNQVWLGSGFSLPHTLERQVADKLVALLSPRVPGWEDEPLGVRFGLSGTDATTMAVRLARAVAKGRKRRILSYGYHGWGDWSVSVTPPAWGVVQGQHVGDIKFNDANELHRYLRTGAKDECGVFGYYEEEPIAAVIIEQPLQGPDPDYWPAVRRLCTEHGALLILDEVVTWPRYSLGGAAQHYGIEPDIICLGKGLGNGIPVSAIVGRREYFEWFARNDPCFVSSTHFGNAVSLAAADAVLDILDDERIEYIWKVGRPLMAGLQAQGYKAIGQPPRFLIEFESLAHKTYFVLGMCDRGILWNRPTFPNCAHTGADVVRTLKAADEIRVEMAKVDIQELMKGKLPMVLFENR